MVADNRFMQGEYEGNEQIMAKDLSLRDQRALVFHLLYSADAFDYGVSFASIVDNFGRDMVLLSILRIMFFQKRMILLNVQKNLILK